MTYHGKQTPQNTYTGEDGISLQSFIEEDNTIDYFYPGGQEIKEMLLKKKEVAIILAPKLFPRELVCRWM